MQISNINNRNVDFGYYQNKTRQDKNASLSPSMTKKSSANVYDDMLKNLGDMKDNLKSKINEIQSKDDLDKDLKDAKIKALNQQLTDIEKQIAQIQEQKQKEKIEKEKEAQKKNEEENKVNEQNGKGSKDLDLGGAIVSGSLLDLVAANKELNSIHSLKEGKTRLDAENLDLEFKPNDKTVLRSNSYRSVKLNKNIKSMNGLEIGMYEKIKNASEKQTDYDKASDKNVKNQDTENLVKKNQEDDNNINKKTDEKDSKSLK